MARNLLYKPVCHLLLVIILGILSYSNTFNAPFQFDDYGNIVENPIIKNLDYYLTPSKAKVHAGQVEYPILINRYIGSLTFALNHKIHGLNVIGYHIVNILIHLINSLLIYWFVYLIFTNLSSGVGGDDHSLLKRASTIALFSSLLFVTHPIQTQAITYIVQRFTSLATMFYLLSMTMYAKARLTINNIKDKDAGGGIRVRALVYYLISLLSAILAMKTKEIAFTLPTMIIIYELLFFQEETKKKILYLAPFILTMLIIPVTIISIVTLGGSVGMETATRLSSDMPRLDYLFTEFRVIITYIRLIFFPVDQNLDYDYPHYHSILNHEVFLSLMSLLLICITVIYYFWKYRKTNALIRVIFFGTSWFFVTLTIESTIIPIKDVIFEHRMYLPSLGIFLTISTLLVMIIERRQRLAQETVFLSIIITALVFTYITYTRNNVWKDEIVLWQDVVNKSPGKSRGHYNLGKLYLDKGLTDESIKALRDSINIEPSFANAHYNLGLAYRERGLLDESIKSYKNAINIEPSHANAYSNLGKAYFAKGLIDESIEAYKDAINIEPSHANAHYSLGLAYGQKGLIDEAFTEMRIGTMLNNKLK